MSEPDTGDQATPRDAPGGPAPTAVAARPVRRPGSVGAVGLAEDDTAAPAVPDADGSPLRRRRAVLAGAATAGLGVAAAGIAGTRGSGGAGTAATTREVAAKPAAAGGFANRGGLDGLSAVVPASDPHLAAARPRIGVPAGALLPLDRTFGLHPALAPLHELWGQGRFTAVHAVSTPDLSRSHFQAQDCLERGGVTSGTTEGWLDRVLDHLGPGTTFRSLAVGATTPRSLAGDQPSVTVRDLDWFDLGGAHGDVLARTRQALAALYTGLDHPLAVDAALTLEGLDTVAGVVAAGGAPGATYPEVDFADRLAELARLIKADVGVRVASVDVGGWDMHTDLGTLDGGAMKQQLTALGDSLGAFAQDLGPRLDQVTVVVMTEFGRRVEQNANAGADHGHGAAVLLLGGGLAGGTVHGHWQELAPDVLEQGDVPGWNDYRDVLAEVVAKRLGLGADAVAQVFPGHRAQPVGVMA